MTARRPGAKPVRVHGEANSCCSKGSAEYRVWGSMKSRCTRPGHVYFKNYGGRGIRVCERWADYRNFLADMGRKPSPKHTLDRIDNDGDYEPGNCRWASVEEQQNNRRNCRFLEVAGRRMTVVQWARAMGIKKTTLKERLRRGWSPERAVSNRKDHIVSAITVCESCRGSGVAQYLLDDSGCPCGPVYDCDHCGGAGEVCDYDALVFGTRDTVPCPGPHECETLPPPAGDECA